VRRLALPKVPTTEGESVAIDRPLLVPFALLTFTDPDGSRSS